MTTTSRSEYNAAWRLKNKARLDAYAAEYRAKNAGWIRAKRLDAYAADPEKFKNAQKKYRPQQRESQRARRKLPTPTRVCPAACECCGREAGRQALALDHNHVTGKFRGWLCGNCNRGVGALGDTAQGIRRALAYLEANDES